MVSQLSQARGINSHWLGLRTNIQILKSLIVTFLIQNVSCVTTVRKTIGEDVSFRCQAETVPDRTYWVGPEGFEKTASRIVVSYDKRYRTSRLMIRDVQLEDRGTYECHINYVSSAVVLSYDLILDGITPISPIIKNKLADSRIEGVEKQQLNITCEADINKSSSDVHRSLANMYLMRNGLRLETSTETSLNGSRHGVISLTYTLIPIREDHLAEFVCTVDDMIDVVSTRAIMYVITAPQTKTISDINLIPEGETMNITCTARKSRPSSNITWQYPFDAAKETAEIIRTVEKTRDEHTVSSTITIIASRNIHLKTVRCMISHIAWETPVTLSKTLLVAFGPDSVSAIGEYIKSESLFFMTCITSPMYREAYFNWIAYSNSNSHKNITTLDVSTLVQSHSFEGSVLYSQTLILNATYALELDVILCEAYNVVTNASTSNCSLSFQASRLSRNAEKNYDACNLATTVTSACFVFIVILMTIIVIVVRNRKWKEKHLVRCANISNSVIQPFATKEHVETISIVDTRYETIGSRIGRNDNVYVTDTPTLYEDMDYTPQDQQYEQLGRRSTSSSIPDAERRLPRHDLQNSDYVNESFS